MGNDFPDFMSPWHEQMRVDHGDEPSVEALNKRPASNPRETTDPVSATRAMVLNAHHTMLEALSCQLLGYIHVQSSEFFEHLIIDVVVALGYASRHRDMARKLGRSGDGGIDGVIELDELGLDAIYLQAKRLKPGTSVAVSAVRDFVGALEAHHATKGVFVTTGNFTPSAQGVVRAISKKIVLINGQQLTKLMVRFNIGTRVTDSLQFKELDVAYFSKAVPKPRTTRSQK